MSWSHGTKWPHAPGFRINQIKLPLLRGKTQKGKVRSFMKSCPKGSMREPCEIRRHRKKKRSHWRVVDVSNFEGVSFETREWNEIIAPSKAMERDRVLPLAQFLLVELRRNWKAGEGEINLKSRYPHCSVIGSLEEERWRVAEMLKMVTGLLEKLFDAVIWILGSDLLG